MEETAPNLQRTERPPSQLEPIQSVSLVPEVQSRLQQYIADNGLQPGDRLPSEGWLSSQMGVGRPLIREALSGLEAVGLIETRRGVGRFVKAFDVEHYLGHFTSEVLVRSFSEHDLAEARCLLEIAAAASAVEQLSDSDCREIEQHLESMRTNALNGDRDSESDIGMHRVIMRRSDNRVVAALLDAVYTLAKAHTALENSDRTMLFEDLLEHERIAEAAIQRDGKATQIALIAHFETTASRLGFRPLWRDLYGKEKEISHTAAG